MKALLAIVLCFIGCATTPRLEKVAVLPSFDAATATIHLRTKVVDIEMRYEDACAAIKKFPRDQEKWLALLEKNRAKKVFSDDWRNDEVGWILLTSIAPDLIDCGQVVVRGVRGGTSVPFILKGWRPRGSIGPYYCLPDRTEFLFREVMIE